MTDRSREALTVLALAAALAAATLAGLPRMLGAHPWWAVQTGLGGTAGGAVAHALLRGLGLRPVQVAAVAAAALLLSLAAAHFGKEAFAASFAENRLAGRFWYFGWYGVAGAALVLLAGLAGYIRTARPAVPAAGPDR